MCNTNPPRLFVPANLPGVCALPAGPTNYLRNVLRLGKGAQVLVFNGRDGEFRAKIEELGKREASLATYERTRAQPAPLTLWYAFAPLKRARLDYMVQKAVEMGAGHLVPVLTQHGQVRQINRERLVANIVEACEQCGVLCVPQIEEPVPLVEFVARLDGAERSKKRTLVVADEALAGTTMDAIGAIAAIDGPIAALIGPEGGFSASERALLADRSVRVSLGPRVLRADTAAVALLALIEAAR